MLFCSELLYICPQQSRETLLQILDKFRFFIQNFNNLSKGKKIPLKIVVLEKSIFAEFTEIFS